MEKILILDFGSQTTQLIARRLREREIYAEIIPGDTKIYPETLDQVKGIILSGSPSSVYSEGAPKPDPYLYSLDLPLLGICYGFQRITKDFGGEVEALDTREYGRSRITLERESPLFKGIPDSFLSWMSHGDSISRLAPGFELIARSEHHPAAFRCKEKRIYGLQFHPEVTHCEFGTDILHNFAVEICNCRKEWSITQFLKQEKEEILEKVGSNKVLLLISGGVDSTVVGALLLSTLKPEQVYLLYIDTGLMRFEETEEVTETLRSLGAKNLFILSAEERFLQALKGVTDPEEKRKIIGDLFITLDWKSTRLNSSHRIL